MWLYKTSRPNNSYIANCIEIFDTFFSEIFDTFFSDKLVSVIVRETNRYAKDCLKKEDTTWETNVNEIRAFIGFIVLMGIEKLRHLYDYWSTSPMLHYFPVASRISRNRFIEIRRYLHFVDNATLPKRGEDGYDKLGKIRPIIDIVNARMIDSCMPHKENLIDEAMIRFKGRSSLKQYVPKKPIRRGIKAWVRADSSNGYICQFDIYIVVRMGKMSQIT